MFLRYGPIIFPDTFDYTKLILRLGYLCRFGQCLVTLELDKCSNKKLNIPSSEEKAAIYRYIGYTVSLKKFKEIQAIERKYHGKIQYYSSLGLV